MLADTLTAIREELNVPNPVMVSMNKEILAVVYSVEDAIERLDKLAFCMYRAEHRDE
jgi:hypothetical protein